MPYGAQNIVEEHSLTAADQIDPESAARSIAVMIRTQGLEATLLTVAAQTSPVQIDEATDPERTQAHGTTLFYVYNLNFEFDELPYEARNLITKGLCAMQEVRPMLSAGATLEHRYKNAADQQIGTVSVTSQDCLS